MPSSPYARELDTAIQAVHLASLVTKALLPSEDKGFRPKADLSPVTIADYAAQAILIATVHHAFPGDHSFLGEESATELRRNRTLCDRVWDLISAATAQQQQQQQSQSDGGSTLSQVLRDRDDMLRYIDHGGDGLGGSDGRVWMLDPLDGTRAFMAGAQYAVCLALVEDGEQKVGVIGCPNLPFGAALVNETVVDSQGYGCLLGAVKGQGSFVRRMEARGLGPPQKIVNPETPPDAIIRIVQPSNAAYDFEKQRRATDRLGAKWPGTKIWSQQMRLVALTLGEGNVQIAFRSRRDYHSCIWDLAGGVLIFEEAGGKVTDADGKALDFGQGRRLEKNWGLVAALSGIHGRVLAAAREADEEEHINGSI